MRLRLGHKILHTKLAGYTKFRNHFAVAGREQDAFETTIIIKM